MGLRSDIVSIVRASEPLFALARRGVAELMVPGVAYLKVEGRAPQGADVQVSIVSRSLLKPWQFLAADTWGEEAVWSLGLASHSGQAHHQEALARLLAITEAREDELFCPRGYPLDPTVTASLKLAHAGPSRLFHPCAGKHLVALASCRQHGYSREQYWDPEHPLQKRLAALIGKELGEKPIWLTDSCGLPTIAVTAKAHLSMWERLALSADPKVKALRELWLANVRMVGGFGRLESDLMELLPGRLIAKEGADGLLMVSALPHKGEPVATCMIKLASGYHTAYLALALYALLARSTSLPSALQSIREHLRSRLETWVPADQELVLPPFTAV